MLQIATAIAQRRDRMTRLNRLRAELEFLERLNTLHTEFVARDKDAQNQVNTRISSAVSNLLDEYSTLIETDCPAVVGSKPPSQQKPAVFRRLFLLYSPSTTPGWVLHTVFYMVGLVFVTWTLFFLVGGSAGGFDSADVTVYAVIGTPLVIVLLVIRGLARRNAAHLEEANA
jgi:hypothetical protein